MTVQGRHIKTYVDLDTVPPAVSSENDEFSGTRAEQQEGSAMLAKKYYVRRPMRGLQIKDETPATITVSGPGDNGLPILNSSVQATNVNFTSNFILQAVNINRTEKFQPVTTFGNTYGFFFGENPVMVTYSALLINSQDFPWQVEWWANYEQNLRGTRLADRNVRVYLEYDDKIIEGYIIQAVTVENASTPHEVPLNFTMWVTNIDYKVTPGDPAYPTASESLTFPDFTLDVSDITGGTLNTLAAVRAGNLEAYNTAMEATGLVGWLRNVVNDTKSVVGAFGAARAIARNALYGRKIVVPAGFAASDFNAGPATFAEGNSVALNLNQFVSVRLPAEFSLPETKTRTFYEDNRDEYPFFGHVSQHLSAEEAKANADLVSREFGIVHTGREFYVGPEGTLRNEVKGDYEIYGRAEAAWAKAGMGGVTNEMGGGFSSEIGLAMARTLFGAISFGASFGVTQSIGDVAANPLNATVNSITGKGFTNTVGGDAITGAAGAATPASLRRSLPSSLTRS